MNKMKGNQRKRTATWVYLGTSKVYVDLTSLFDVIIVPDRRDLRHLPANYAWLTVTFWTGWRLTINPIGALMYATVYSRQFLPPVTRVVSCESLTVYSMICTWWTETLFGTNSDVFSGNSHVIAPSCKIHNDASCDISSDGKLLATFVPSAQGFPDDGVVAVYSLEKATLGQCLFAKKFGKSFKRAN